MTHEAYMQRCLQLAANGAGHVAPNPMVGCVIVHQERIIGEGWHRELGAPHAEVNALNSITDLPRNNVTLYVSLEPCSHLGRTPPCAERLIQEGVQRVVIGCLDPNPKVSGNGTRALQEAGIEVIHGVMEKECRQINERFITFHEKKRPYIILKWAQTADGLLDQHPRNERRTQHISSNAANDLVHDWRAQEAAIMVGSRTALNDDPALTVRRVAGKQPLRVLLDRHGVVPSDSKIFISDAATLVLGQCHAEGDHIYRDPVAAGEDPIEATLGALHDREINSLLVEGGAELLDHFLQRRLWDEVRVIHSPVVFGKGTAAPSITFAPSDKEQVGDDMIFTYHNPAGT